MKSRPGQIELKQALVILAEGYGLFTGYIASVSAIPAVLEVMQAR